MPKIKFENGVVVNVEGNPTQADIEEIASQMGIKKAETPGGVTGAFKRGWQGLKEDLNKRVDNTGQAMNANQSGASKALQVAGQGFGTIGDVIGAGVTTAASALTPDDAEQAIKTKFTEGVKKIMETNIAKSTMDKYSKFKEENPELAGNIEAIGNISDAFLNAVGVGAAEKGVATAGKSVFKAGVKGVGELASAGEKSVDFTKKIADMGKRFGQGAKEKFAESKLGEKVADVISPMDNNVKKTIDPLASVPAENIPNIPKEVIEKAKEATSGRLEYYLNKARRATQNPSLPTPLEFAGKKAEEALNTIGKKISKYSQLKKSETEAFKDKVINGVGEIRTKLMDSLGEIAGVELDEAGEFVAKAGRTLAISDKADLQLVKNINSKLASLGDNPSFKQVDDAVDYLQDLLYKKKANLAQPINSKIEGMVKKITGELNGKLRQAGSKLYRESNQSISRMMDVREKLNKALGRDANKGGSLMKRVFSPTDGGTKELFKEIKRITGIDLNEEATLAKFAMEQLGDARQANLLEQLELIKGAVGARGSFLKNIAEKAGKAAVGDQVERARRILKKRNAILKVVSQHLQEGAESPAAVLNSAKNTGKTIIDTAKQKTLKGSINNPLSKKGSPSVGKTVKNNPYRYHETDISNLESIQRTGLKVKEGQYGRGVYFAPEVGKNETSGKGVILRANKKNLEQLGHEEFPDQGWTESSVPSGILEYSKDKGKTWKPLSQPLQEVNPLIAPVAEKVNKLPLKNLIDVEGEPIKETIKKIPTGEKSMTKGAIDVAKTEDGYMVLDGQHRASEALKAGKSDINVNILSKKEAIKKYGDRWPEAVEFISEDTPPLQEGVKNAKNKEGGTKSLKEGLKKLGK